MPSIILQRIESLSIAKICIFRNQFNNLLINQITALRNLEYQVPETMFDDLLQPQLREFSF